MEFDDGIPFRALQVFAILARSGNQKNAAAKLGVSSSAVSQQVRQLESWIGTPLFVDGSRATRLTPIGTTLFETIRLPLDSLVSSCKAIRRNTQSASVSVSAPIAYMSFHLVPRLSTFWANHPDIEIDLRVTQTFDAPVDFAETDLALRFVHHPGDGEIVGRTGWSAFCRADYFEELGRPTDISQLSDAVLLHEHIFNYWPKAFELAKIKLPKAIVYRAVGDANTVLASLLGGGALALLPTELPRQLVRQGTLMSPFRVKIEPEASYVLFSRELGHNQDLEAVRKFIVGPD